jgi:Mn2+/Fe2+ NRAMP family transporter
LGFEWPLAAGQTASRRTVPAFGVFALGVIGTGLLAIPVLAGSAGYAMGEARKWPTGLNRKPLEAKAFYVTIAIATLLGACLNFTSVNPIKALYWSAVVNGMVAVRVMAVMMLMTGRPDIMGKATVPPVPRCPSRTRLPLVATRSLPTRPADTS